MNLQHGVLIDPERPLRAACPSPETDLGLGHFYLTPFQSQCIVYINTSNPSDHRFDKNIPKDPILCAWWCLPTRPFPLAGCLFGRSTALERRGWATTPHVIPRKWCSSSRLGDWTGWGDGSKKVAHEGRNGWKEHQLHRNVSFSFYVDLSCFFVSMRS